MPCLVVIESLAPKFTPTKDQICLLRVIRYSTENFYMLCTLGNVAYTALSWKDFWSWTLFALLLNRLVFEFALVYFVIARLRQWMKNARPFQKHITKKISKWKGVWVFSSGLVHIVRWAAHTGEKYNCLNKRKKQLFLKHGFLQIKKKLKTASHGCGGSAR